MKVGSMFAGIGGFDLGFTRAGFTVAWCIEWDKSAQAVLRKRFPEATIYGDIREVDPEQLEKVDVICGGFPCQDLSVAGKRKGLAGERSGLFHDAMRLVRRINPSLLVLENVPGLLSSNRGLDFATVLREVGEGWDCSEVAWRVLDSRYFGVAQRRRRVFVVASAREGCAEQVLALAEGVQWHPAPRDEAREDSAGDAAKCFAGNRESSVTAALETTSHDYSRADGFTTIVGAIDCDIPKQRAQNAAQGHYIAIPINGFCLNKELTDKQMTGIGSNGEPMYTCRADGTQHAVDFHPTQDPISSTEQTHALGCGSKQGCATVAVATRMVVRRLTPVECERLQGFPDGWTQIGTADKPTADSHRYKQLGNAVTVNVAEWIARRAIKALKGNA